MNTDYREKELAVGLLAEYPYGHPDFVLLCLEEMKLHSDKNKDYTSGDKGNPLGNFYRVSAFLLDWGVDIPPHLVAFAYMMKQIDAVGNMLGNDYEGKVEGIEKRLQDIAVYAKLIQILYKEAKE